MNMEIPQPDSGGLRKGPPRTPPKTAAELPDPDPGDFEKLLRQLKPKLDKLPNDLRIPAVPPNADAAEEVEEYVQEKLGLSRASSVPNWVIIGNECVERPKMHEGRIGLLDGVPVFAFLYPYEAKRHRTVVIHARDGIDPRMLAKAILWGLVGEIPAQFAQSEIRSVDDFFGLRCLAPDQLYDQARLVRAKAEIERQAAAKCASLRNTLERTQTEAEGLRKALAEASRLRDSFKAKFIEHHNRAELWKLLAWGAVCLIPVALLVARWLGG